MTGDSHPDGCALVMTEAELRRLEADLLGRDARRAAEGELRAFWRAARAQYPDLKAIERTT